MSDPTLDAVDAIVERGGDVDDVLRDVVAELARTEQVAWASIRFLEQGALVQGPQAGSPDEARRSTVPIVYEGTPVGELQADGDVDPSLLREIADRVSAHVLLGWDTGGEAWEP